MAGLALLAAAVAAACGATPSATATGGPTAATTGSAIPTAPGRVPTAPPTPAASATPRPSSVAATPGSFWAAAERGLTSAKHLQVTIAGANPGVLRFEPGASATIVGGRVVFVCIARGAFDGQSGFARVPGTWECGGAALVSGFRHIGQPADSWNGTSPTDNGITETVSAAADGTWTWAYAGTSPFYGGRVTARVTLDATSGRLLAARRVDPTGTTTYRFDYGVTFPALAVPGG